VAIIELPDSAHMRVLSNLGVVRGTPQNVDSAKPLKISDRPLNMIAAKCRDRSVLEQPKIESGTWHDM
jgi:hypothetical protein